MLQSQLHAIEQNVRAGEVVLRRSENVGFYVFACAGAACCNRDVALARVEVHEGNARRGIALAMCVHQDRVIVGGGVEHARAHEPLVRQSYVIVRPGLDNVTIGENGCKGIVADRVVGQRIV